MLPDLKFQTSVNFTKSEICLSYAFCHACLNLLMDELAVAQCSSFVKHHEWIKVTKGLLLSSLSSSMPCFILPCSVPVAYSFIAPKSAI